MIASLIPIEKAIRFGYPFWELIAGNWGNRGANGDPFSLRVPISHSIYGASIAPTSNVHSVRVGYSLIGALPSTPGGPPEGQLENEIVVSNRAPWIGEIPGPIVIKAVRESQFDDVYFVNGEAVAQPFGQALGYNTVFEEPRLRLLLHLRPGLTPPSQRPPAQLVGLNSTGFSFGAPDVEEVKQVINVGGRSRVRVTVRVDDFADPNDVVDVRLMGVTGAAIGEAVQNQLVEFQLAPALGAATIGPNGIATFDVVEPQCQWLVLRAKASDENMIVTVNYDRVD